MTCCLELIDCAKRFDPMRSATPTRTAIASLYALSSDWYRVDELTQVLAAELSITAKWLENAFRWAARGGALRWRRYGAWRLVHVDPDRMARAWPHFDPRSYSLVPLEQLEPVDVERKTA